MLRCHLRQEDQASTNFAWQDKGQMRCPSRCRTSGMVRGAGLRAGGEGNVLGTGRQEGRAGKGRGDAESAQGAGRARVLRTGRQRNAWEAGMARGMLATGERGEASASVTFLFWEQITAKKA